MSTALTPSQLSPTIPPTGDLNLLSKGRALERGRCPPTAVRLGAVTGPRQHHTYFTDSAPWLCEDPKGFAASDANLYRYARNRPTITVDPSGLQPPGGTLPTDADRKVYDRDYPENSIWRGHRGRVDDTGWSLGQASITWNAGGPAHEYGRWHLLTKQDPEGAVFGVVKVDAKNRTFEVKIQYDAYNYQALTGFKDSDRVTGNDKRGEAEIEGLRTGKITYGLKYSTGDPKKKYEITDAISFGTSDSWYQYPGTYGSSKIKGKESKTVTWIFKGKIPPPDTNVGPLATIITYHEKDRSFQEQMVIGWWITGIKWDTSGATPTIADYKAYVRIAEQATGANAGLEPTHGADRYFRDR